MPRTLISFIAALLLAPLTAAQDGILTHRQQAALQKRWIEKRFETVLPALMREQKIDMWIIVSREYNDDPVFRSMSPATTFSSRRRTILVFTDRGQARGVERLSIGRFDYEGLYEVIRTHNDGQWEGLRKIVEERDPAVIGINISKDFSHADGLSSTEKENLVRALGEKYAARLTSAERLAGGWLEAKLPEETDAYRHAVGVAHKIIAEAFSDRVIVPGVTTDVDVAWWMRQRVANLGLGSWFHPSITVWRKGGLPTVPDGSGHTIERGDMLHCDFGLVYLGFSTDTQHNAYVLRPGERDAPQGLKDGLQEANRLQDITLEHAVSGATGNSALAAALAQARKEGLQPAIYCHPIGYHGHGAGTPIGMTDYQEGVPSKGDYRFRRNSWHSIELNVSHRVPEWGNQQVLFALEEDAVLGDTGWQWVADRQTRFYLIH